MPGRSGSQKVVYFLKKHHFKKMPPGNLWNRIRDFWWATLLVVKGYPKYRYRATTVEGRLFEQQCSHRLEFGVGRTY